MADINVSGVNVRIDVWNTEDIILYILYCDHLLKVATRTGETSHSAHVIRGGKHSTHH